MDEKALLLLGLLRVQSQHGYQINEFIEKNLSRVTDMKKATAYAVLDRLSTAGYVSVHKEREGNRPPRKVFSLTDKGERRFNELLKENLAQADTITLPGDIGLMFIDHLSRADVVECLKVRLNHLNNRLTTMDKMTARNHSLGVKLALEHVKVLAQADRNWLQQTLEQLADG